MVNRNSINSTKGATAVGGSLNLKNKDYIRYTGFSTSAALQPDSRINKRRSMKSRGESRSPITSDSNLMMVKVMNRDRLQSQGGPRRNIQ